MKAMMPHSKGKGEDVIKLFTMEDAEIIAMGFALHGLPVSVSAHNAFLELLKHCDTYDCYMYC
jgi:hypothetical protein